ncbi:MAG: hypothetical protein IJJ00_05055 [Erysipelotrichaceae bacterium]|nr:hypothetical protein [Erysipelotrichaceae bacterium]
MKTLVAYFSYIGETELNRQVVEINKGHTEIVAEKIARMTGADLYKIEPVTPYPKKYDDIVAIVRKENEENPKVEIRNLLPSIAEYDTVYIGFPIWYRTYPRVVASFLSNYDFTGKTVKPFCTNDEGSFGIALLELKSQLKGADVKPGIAIHGADVNAADDKLEAWVRQ